MKRINGWIAGCLAGLALAGVNARAVEAGRFQCGIVNRGLVPRYAGAVGDPAPTGFAPRGTQRLLYVRVRFSDDAMDPVSTEDATAELRTASDLFRRISHGQFDIAPTVTPVVTLPRPASYYSAGGFTVLVKEGREAAAAMGFNFEDYDLDIIRHNALGGFMGGHGVLGGRGITIQAAGASVIVHEIGHNLGLGHANFWDTAGPSSSPKVSPPFPSNLNEGRNGHPFDPDSLAGHASVNGPGVSSEYGDPFDIMGSGNEFNGGQVFNAPHKYQVGWLPPLAVATVVRSGIHRIFAHDTGPLVSGNQYAIRIPAAVLGAGVSHDYWAELQPADPERETPRDAVLLHWGVPSGEGSQTDLLDTTFGTPAGQLDAALPLGRTFTDPALDLHLTPVASGRSGGRGWIDIAVQIGTPMTNQPPTLRLVAGATNLNPSEIVQFTAAVQDPNGDQLSYFWDLGDGTVAANEGSISKSWRAVGEYVVRCEVTDTRGGMASAHVLVTVGDPRTGHIVGRVLDPDGRGVPHVRVQNGYWNSGDGEPGYRVTYTDSDGAYTLADMAPAAYQVGAFLHGYRTEPVGDSAPIRLGAREQGVANFIARPIPTVSITAVDPVVDEGGIADFILTRSGPLNDGLSLPIRLAGSATGGSDYAAPFINRVQFPPGVATVHVVLPIFDDRKPEPDEDIVLSSEAPRQVTKVITEGGRPVEVSFYYPGWELRTLGDTDYWSQTDPVLLLSEPSRVVIRGQVPDSGPAASLQIGREPSGRHSLALSGASGRTAIMERSTDFLGWVPVDVVVFGDATRRVPLESVATGALHFFRLRLVR